MAEDVLLGGWDVLLGGWGRAQRAPRLKPFWGLAALVPSHPSVHSHPRIRIGLKARKPPRPSGLSVLKFLRSISVLSFQKHSFVMKSQETCATSSQKTGSAWGLATLVPSHPSVPYHPSVHSHPWKRTGFKTCHPSVHSHPWKRTGFKTCHPSVHSHPRTRTGFKTCHPSVHSHPRKRIGFKTCKAPQESGLSVLKSLRCNVNHGTNHPLQKAQTIGRTTLSIWAVEVTVTAHSPFYMAIVIKPGPSPTAIHG